MRVNPAAVVQADGHRIRKAGRLGRLGTGEVDPHGQHGPGAFDILRYKPGGFLPFDYNLHRLADFILEGSHQRPFGVVVNQIILSIVKRPATGHKLVIQPVELGAAVGDLLVCAFLGQLLFQQVQDGVAQFDQFLGCINRRRPLELRFEQPTLSVHLPDFAILQHVAIRLPAFDGANLAFVLFLQVGFVCCRDVGRQCLDRLVQLFVQLPSGLHRILAAAIHRACGRMQPHDHLGVVHKVFIDQHRTGNALLVILFFFVFLLGRVQFRRNHHIGQGGKALPKQIGYACPLAEDQDVSHYLRPRARLECRVRQANGADQVRALCQPTTHLHPARTVHGKSTGDCHHQTAGLHHVNAAREKVIVNGPPIVIRVANVGHGIITERKVTDHQVGAIVLRSAALFETDILNIACRVQLLEHLAGHLIQLDTNPPDLAGKIVRHQANNVTNTRRRFYGRTAIPPQALDDLP